MDKCIYCKREVGGMITTGNGYACPICLIKEVERLLSEVEELREFKRIWGEQEANKATEQG